MTMGNGNVYLIKKIKIIIDYTSHDSSLKILGIIPKFIILFNYKLFIIE